MTFDTATRCFLTNYFDLDGLNTNILLNAQLTVSGLSGKRGSPVQWHVVVVIKSPGGPVMTRRLLSEELTVKGIACALDHATKGDVPVIAYPSFFKNKLFWRTSNRYSFKNHPSHWFKFSNTSSSCLQSCILLLLLLLLLLIISDRIWFSLVFYFFIFFCFHFSILHLLLLLLLLLLSSSSSSLLLLLLLLLFSFTRAGSFLFWYQKNYFFVLNPAYYLMCSTCSSCTSSRRWFT